MSFFCVMEISQRKFKNWSDNNDPKLKENCMDNKIEKKTPLNLEKKKLNPDKFVRYSEGAQMYHMSVSKFMQLAKDAKACYKLGGGGGGGGGGVDQYIETFRIIDDDFYK